MPGKLIGRYFKKVIRSTMMAEMLFPEYKSTIDAMSNEDGIGNKIVEESRDAYCQFADDPRTSAIYDATISASGQR